LVDVVRRQALDSEQMAVRERSLGGASVHEPGTIGGAASPGKKCASPGCHQAIVPLIKPKGGHAFETQPVASGSLPG
jgi:hypothetical protein